MSSCHNEEGELAGVSHLDRSSLWRLSILFNSIEPHGFVCFCSAHHAHSDAFKRPMLQDKENRDVKEIEQAPLEPVAAQPESNGTLDASEGQAAGRRRQEHANGDSHERADEPRETQASSAGAGQATQGLEGRGRPQDHPYVCLEGDILHSGKEGHNRPLITGKVLGDCSPMEGQGLSS